MVEHLKRHYGRESAWVMDPVFLLGRERWEELARQAPPAAKGRIVSYILDPAAEKGSSCWTPPPNSGSPC